MEENVKVDRKLANNLRATLNINTMQKKLYYTQFAYYVFVPVGYNFKQKTVTHRRKTNYRVLSLKNIAYDIPICFWV